ncbi:MAG: hypothetical protein HC896_01605, partial [Bacteroidales bacterium]|nr:hypothetical protein [Bacteroidales bacterium]
NNTFTSPGVLTSGVSYISTTAYDGKLPTGEGIHYLNTTKAAPTVSGNITDYIANEASPLIIGTFHEGDNRHFQGDLAEVIIYRTALNEAQRQILENYLAAKYGITVLTNIFSGNDAAYTNDIAGIGQESGTFHDLSSSAGMYLAPNGGLNNGDFLMAAHNNAVNDTNSFRNNAEITASGAVEAWNRDWYIEKTGNLNARISFDFSEALNNSRYPVNPANYILLYRAGTSGNYSVVTVVAQDIANGDQVYFDVSDANLLSGYYTLATLDDLASPLQGIPGNTCIH